MALGIWEARQAVVTLLQADAITIALLADGADSVFDSRPEDESWEAVELPALVVDTPQDTWQSRSANAPTYESTANFVIEAHVAPLLSAAATAKLRDQVISAAVFAVLGNADFWDTHGIEQPGSVTMSMTTSIGERRRAAAQVQFSLKRNVEIPFVYSTETTLLGYDVTVDMLDPEQTATDTEITASWPKIIGPAFSSGFSSGFVVTAS